MTARSYRTVAHELRHESDKIKGSRFIATVRPIRDESEVPAVVTELRTEFPDANHHCYAYRLGPGKDRFRYSDDGEPSGTGGKPILQRIDGHELTDVLVVVSRIFGGTKLGAGGLIRAYGGAAGMALDHVEVREVRPVRRVTLRFPYDLTGRVRSVLTSAGLEAIEPAFAQSVEMGLEIPEDEADTVIARIRERTAGRATVIEEDSDA